MPNEMPVYQNPDSIIKIDVRLENVTVWLTQSQMGQLTGKNKRTISEDISNFYSGGKWDDASIFRKFRTVQTDLYFKFEIFEFQPKVI